MDDFSHELDNLALAISQLCIALFLLSLYFTGLLLEISPPHRSQTLSLQGRGIVFWNLCGSVWQTFRSVKQVRRMKQGRLSLLLLLRLYSTNHNWHSFQKNLGILEYLNVLDFDRETSTLPQVITKLCLPLINLPISFAGLSQRYKDLFPHEKVPLLARLQILTQVVISVWIIVQLVIQWRQVRISILVLKSYHRERPLDEIRRQFKEHELQLEETSRRIREHKVIIKRYRAEIHRQKAS